MKTCPSCQHTQNAGNFCGKCGAELVKASPTPSQEAEPISSQPEQSVSTQDTAPIQNTSSTQHHNQGQTQQAQPETAATGEENPAGQSAPNAQLNESVENIKAESKQYFNYFLNQLKAPSQLIGNDTSNFKNGLISLIIYSLLTGIAFYIIFPYSGGLIMSDYGEPTLLKILFVIGIFFAVLHLFNLLTVLVTTKLFSNDLTFKRVFNLLSSYYVIPAALSAVIVLLALLKSIGTTSMLIMISFTLSFGIVPLFVVIMLLTQDARIMDRFYAFLFYIVLNIVAFIALMLFVVDSILGEYISFFL